MFDLPGRDDIVEVRVTEATVTQKQPPLLEIAAQSKKKEA
jgi:ATP-dependent Clp protease ATP-binding subunit ClpX